MNKMVEKKFFNYRITKVLKKLINNVFVTETELNKITRNGLEEVNSTYKQLVTHGFPVSRKIINLKKKNHQLSRPNRKNRLVFYYIDRRKSKSGGLNE